MPARHKFRLALTSPHALPVVDVLKALAVSVNSGLGKDEAGRRLQNYGPNVIVGRQRVGPFAIFVHQFQSLVVALLAVAAGLAFYFREWEEGGAIAGVLALNALIGFITEFKAVRSIEALRALGTHSVRVRRDGHTQPIAAERLVPGDVVVVDAGDVIPADLRLVEASNLDANESALTGESMAVSKSVTPVAAEARVSDQASMLFKGTSMTRAAPASESSPPPAATPNSAGSRRSSKRPFPKLRRSRRSSPGFRGKWCGRR
jgi:Ca2+-transporting ATPase